MTGCKPIDPEDAEDKLPKYQGAITALREVIRLQEQKEIPLRKEMLQALETKMLGLWKWEGPYSSAGHIREHKPHELLVTAAACAASPLGVHVVSRIMAQPLGAYVQGMNATCFCCREKLTYTSKEFGWQTRKERRCYVSAIQALKDIQRNIWKDLQEREAVIRKAMAAIDAAHIETDWDRRTLADIVDKAFTKGIQ